MKYWIDTDNNEYYLGDRLHPWHIEVSERPSALYEWVDNQWVISKTLCKNKVSENRYNAEVSGTIWNGLGIATDRESQTKLLVEKLAAENGSRLDGENWKCFDLTKGTAVFRLTTNLEMIDIANTAYNHVRDCFRREAELLSIIDSGTFTEDMLDQGWPVTWM